MKDQQVAISVSTHAHVEWQGGETRQDETVAE
jgi:hypothetical protein